MIILVSTHLVVEGLVVCHLLLAPEHLVHAPLAAQLVAAVGGELHVPGVVSALWRMDREG